MVYIPWRGLNGNENLINSISPDIEME